MVNERYIEKYGLNTSKLIEIVEKYSTPVIIFIKGRVSDNVEVLRTYSRLVYKNTYIYYSLKANNLAPILEELKGKDNIGLEIASPIEFEIALKFKFKRLIINGLSAIFSYYRTDEPFFKKFFDHFNAFSNDTLIVINSLSEARLLNKILTRTNSSPVNVLLRVNMALPMKYQKNILVDVDYRNGFVTNYTSVNDELEKAVKEITGMKYLKIKGLAIHKLINVTSPEPYNFMLKQLIDKSNKLINKYGVDLEYLDLGGGLHTRYKLEEKICKNKIEKKCYIDFFKNIYDKIELNGYKIIMEPGKFIVGDAFIGLTKIIDIRIKTYKRWAIIDLGANFLIPLKRAEYDFINIKNSENNKKLFYVGDYSVSSIGVFTYKPIKLSQDTRAGDILLVLNVGAYTFPFANNFLSPKPLVLSFSRSGEIRVIKEREKISDLVEGIFSNKW